MRNQLFELDSLNCDCSCEISDNLCKTINASYVADSVNCVCIPSCPKENSTCCLKNLKCPDLFYPNPESCRCECALSDFICEQINSKYHLNTKTCQCECKKNPFLLAFLMNLNTFCGKEKIFDKNVCGCICKSPEKDCEIENPLTQWSSSTCKCECKANDGF